MTVLLKTAFDDWQIVDLKLTKGVLNTVLQGKFQCYELLPGVIVVHNPEGAARSMPLSCCCKAKDVFFFGPVLVTGIDQKSGKRGGMNERQTLYRMHQMRACLERQHQSALETIHLPGV